MLEVAEIELDMGGKLLSIVAPTLVTCFIAGFTAYSLLAIRAFNRLGQTVYNDEALVGSGSPNNMKRRL